MIKRQTVLVVTDVRYDLEYGCSCSGLYQLGWARCSFRAELQLGDVGYTVPGSDSGEGGSVAFSRSAGCGSSYGWRGLGGSVC